MKQKWSVIGSEGVALAENLLGHKTQATYKTLLLLCF